MGAELVVPDGLPSAVTRLVKDGLVTEALKHQYKPVITVNTAGSREVEVAALKFGTAFQAFLVDRDNRPLAGRFQRLKSQSEWWVIPGYAPHHERWLAAAIACWREDRPELFPGEAHWQSRPEWRTDRELAADSEVNRARTTLESEVTRLAADLASAEAIRDEETVAADGAERRLLTSQGDELKDEVAQALKELGFGVIDADVDIAVRGDLREDLRLTEPSDATWIGLVEVRGYTRGAQQTDLLRLSARFGPRYYQESGKLPSALWYVVNHFIGQDPTVRPKPLESSAADLELFAEANGLVLDTRTLFRLRMDVRLGLATADAVRSRLRSHTGRLDLN